MYYKALDGAKVVEYGNLISGPFCAKILADLGAEVIKIEDPGCGDDSRRQAPFLKDIPGIENSGMFLYLNMNKLGVTLNLETTTGKKILGELLKNATVFVENNPPRRMKELELSYEYVKQINPRIVMTSITPFGQTGPYKDYKGGELVNTHLGGVGYLSTREGRCQQGAPEIPGAPFQFSSGFERRRSNTGFGVPSEDNRRRDAAGCIRTGKCYPEPERRNRPLFIH